MAGVHNMMLKKGQKLVQLFGATYTHGVTTGTAVARFDLFSSGIADGDETGEPNTYSWLLIGASGDYEVLATLLTGTMGGTFNTWLNLGTNRGWANSRNVDGETTGKARFEIRKVGETGILATAEITLTAKFTDLGGTV